MQDRQIALCKVIAGIRSLPINRQVLVEEDLGYDTHVPSACELLNRLAGCVWPRAVRAARTERESFPRLIDVEPASEIYAHLAARWVGSDIAYVVCRVERLGIHRRCARLALNRFDSIRSKERDRGNLTARDAQTRDRVRSHGRSIVGGCRIELESRRRYVEHPEEALHALCYGCGCAISDPRDGIVIDGQHKRKRT